MDNLEDKCMYNFYTNETNLISQHSWYAMYVLFFSSV